MAALILSLIDKQDSSELLRDEIAAILAVEIANQKTLATAASKDPRLWNLRVFSERADPWSEFVDAPDDIDTPPIVNVTFDGETFDKSKGNVIERQQATMTFNIDCYGYGVATATDEGHEPGDLRAAHAMQRAVRLVRNVLMSGLYVYLGHRGLVGGRWITSINVFQPGGAGQPVQNVIAARIALEVSANEFAPQYEAQSMELISAQVKRAGTGEIFLTADYDVSDS